MMTSPGEYQADSPKCIIRIPTAQLPKQQLHPTQESKVVDQKDKKSEETDRSSIRAASVTRPRAVLSSPDNDEMIGSNNSKRVIQPSPLRNHNMDQKRHMEPKIIPLQTTTETPVSTRRKPASAVNEHTPSTAGRLHSTKGKPKTVKDQTLTKSKQSGIVASSQKAHLKTHKANSII